MELPSRAPTYWRIIPVFIAALFRLACDKTTRHVLRNTVISSWTRGEPIKNGTAIKAFYSRVNIKDFSIAKININCDWHHKSFGGLFTSSIVPPLTGATCGRYKKNTSRPTPSDPLLLTDRETDRLIASDCGGRTTILLVSR